MSVEQPLRKLESFVQPAESTKGGWLGPAYSEMVRWIRSLAPSEQEAVIAELPRWLHDDTPWHAEGVLTLMEALGAPSLYEAAIGHARRLGVHDSPNGKREPWESFHRHLIAQIASNPVSEAAERYIEELAEQAPWATSRSRQNVALAAWFVRCRMRDGGGEARCLESGLQLLRATSHAGVHEELISFLSTLYREPPARRATVEALLTSSERQRFNW